MPRFLHRDRDFIFGKLIQKKLTALEIQQAIGARKPSWQNPYTERVIGSIRQKCKDHIIALDERHLLRTSPHYVTYQNEARCHLIAEHNAPQPRPIEIDSGEVVATPRSSHSPRRETYSSTLEEDADHRRRGANRDHDLQVRDDHRQQPSSTRNRPSKG